LERVNVREGGREGPGVTPPGTAFSADLGDSSNYSVWSSWESK